MFVSVATFKDIIQVNRKETTKIPFKGQKNKLNLQKQPLKDEQKFLAIMTKQKVKFTYVRKIVPKFDYQNYSKVKSLFLYNAYPDK